jgi:heat shock protein HslJ
MSMHLRAFPIRAFSMIVLSALAACGGGGGGGGSVIQPAPAHVEVPFTSFSAIAPNQTVIMPGLSQTGSGTGSAFNLDPVDANNSTAKLSFGSDGKLSGISLSAPRSGVSFGASEIFCRTSGGCGAGDAATFAALMSAPELGWNYQSFGVWMKDATLPSFQAGAISAGAVSPASALPLSTGVFTGHAGGFYFDGNGNQSTTDAQMRAVANFQNRTIDFSTSGTLLNSTAPTPGLDLAGTLNYAPGGINQFSGDVKTQNNELTGKATGRFYGPSAQEIGGTYGLGSTDGKRMLGGFGGKR